MSATGVGEIQARTPSASTNDWLPEGWANTTIGVLLRRGGSIKTGPFGTTLRAAEYSIEGVPVISVGEIGRGALTIRKETPRVSLEVLKRLPEYRLNEGDIVFGRKGAVDRSALIGPKQDGWFLGSDGIRLRLPSSVLPEYAIHQLQTLQTKNWLIANSVGTTMASLNQEVLGRLPFLLAPEQEQRNIATALSNVDTLISGLDALIEKKRAIKLAMIQNLLTGRMRSHHSGTWVSGPLGEFADLLTGFPFPSRGFARQGIRLVRGSNVKRGVIDWSDEISVYWPGLTGDLARYQLREGDLLIAMDGALVGRSFAVIQGSDLPCLLVQRVARLRATRMNPQLMAQLVCSEQFGRHVDSTKTQTAIPHISAADIRSFVISFPADVGEQDRIATLLCEVDGEICSLERRRYKLKLIRQAMMQSLLTARTRLVGREVVA